MLKNVEKIVISEKRCKRCGICVKFCPTGVLAQDASGSVFVEDISSCIACMSCQDHCPDLAIEVFIS
ncbi:MAG: 4Fe-4S binding protein [Caldisericia bacterium]|nr:4Fe-4S binding protein [Caldisericia bacterium]